MDIATCVHALSIYANGFDVIAPAGCAPLYVCQLSVRFESVSKMKFPLNDPSREQSNMRAPFAGVEVILNQKRNVELVSVELMTSVSTLRDGTWSAANARFTYPLTPFPTAMPLLVPAGPTMNEEAEAGALAKLY